MNIKILAAFALSVSPLVCSCDNDNDRKDYEPTETSSGFYILNQGNSAGNIGASLTAYDYSSGQGSESLEDAFKKANGFSLGDDAMAIEVYGSKMYIAVSTSDVIWAVDKVTLKALGQIRASGEQQGHTPRGLAAAGGKVFATMFNGYVACIDTVSLAIEREIAVGPNPEGMAVAGGKLYVANSDGWNYLGACAGSSVSIIDLKDYSERKVGSSATMYNPTLMGSNGSEVFVLCMGDYASIPATLKKLGSDGSVADVGPATLFEVNGDKVMAINSPYGSAPADRMFAVYDAKTLAKVGNIAEMVPGTDSEIEYATGIATDRVTGDIVILSNFVDPTTGWANYSDPGYANIYSADGKFRQRISTGVGPLSVAFIHSYE